jgi:hypothetical protein
MVVVVCAACGGQSPAAAPVNGVAGKAFLLGQSDHSGIRVSALGGTGILASSQTDAAGSFELKVPAGAYDLRFEHAGYQPAVRPDVGVANNGVTVAATTLYRGALLVASPLASAQPLGGSKALVQFDEGVDSPTHLVDLAAGTIGLVSMGRVDALASNDQFATVRADQLYRLDLASGTVAIVRPVEAARGVTVSGNYFYVGTDNRLNVLATGKQLASPYAFAFCYSAPDLSVSEVAPSWFSVDVVSDCATGSRIKMLLNPNIQQAWGPYTSLLVRAGRAYFVETLPTSAATGNGGLRRIDLTSALEKAIGGSASGFETLSGDDRFVVITGNAGPSLSTYSFLDLQSETVSALVSDVAVAASYPGNDLPPVARLLQTASGTAFVMRLDTHKMTFVCGSTPATVGGSTALGFRPGQPAALACGNLPVLGAYEWNTDASRELTRSATGYVQRGRVAVWTEGTLTRAARLGDGEAPVTLCATQATLAVGVSGDNRIATLGCPDPDGRGRVIAVDVGTGAVETLVASQSGQSIDVSQVAVSALGRGAVVNYTTNALAPDPAACGASRCTVVYDRVTGATAFTSPALVSFTALVSPDDRGFALDSTSLAGRTLIARFGDGAPALAAVDPVEGLLGIAANGNFALVATRLFGGGYALLHLLDDAVAPLSALPSIDRGPPVRLGFNNDFVAGEGIVHLDTGTIDFLPPSWTPLCAPSSGRVAYFDSTNTILEEYLTGIGGAVLASGVVDLHVGSCFDAGMLFLSNFDGHSGLLLHYRDAGVFVAAADVSPRIASFPQGRFAFQHPDLVSGDLLLIDGEENLKPVGVRAHLGTTFATGGGRVGFTGGGANEEPKLMVVNADGTGARTLGPSANRLIFSPDGSHLLFEARGLLWAEDPAGPGAALDEAGDIGTVVVSGGGDVLLYSVRSGERRGTYRVDLRQGSTSAAGPDSAGSVWIPQF